MALRRESAALLGAVLLHVAVFAWLEHLPRSSRETTEGDRSEVVLDVENVPPEHESSSFPTAPTAGDEAPPASKVAGTMARTLDRPAPSESAEPSALPAESGSAFAFHPSVPGLTDRSLGLDGHNVFLSGFLDRPDGAAPSEATVANVAPGVDRSMRDVLQARDHDLGLDVGGPLLAIAEELTRPSDTPLNGGAVLEVTLDEVGTITGVRVVDAASERPSWERLALQMAAAFRSRRVALRTRGRGLVVTMEVSSRWALPSGRSPGHPVTAPYVRPGDTVGGYVVAGAGFDVSDIGARPHRDVHARILHEQPR